MESEPRIEENDFALNTLRELIVDEYQIVPKSWVIDAIDKLLDRRLEINEDM